VDKNFYTIDGRVLKNLEDLKQYLKETSEENFQYHKLHFKRWLIDIFKDCKNAIRIKIAKNKKDALRLLDK
jgi:hypothetical protein